MPVTSFGESLDTMGMFMHESVSDSFNKKTLEEVGQPMALVTGNRSYKIEVFWEPIEIKPNQIVTFDIKFINYVTNKVVKNVYYDFAVTKDDQLIKELRSSFAMNGLATHTVEFPSSGSFSVMVNVLGIGHFSGPQNESVAFDLKVVPEFPLSTMIVMASVVGIMIALTRFTVMSKKRGM
ncbi:MAG: hypothetical protein ACE5KA_06395 [Nitrososphaerales archaeon]